MSPSVADRGVYEVVEELPGFKVGDLLDVDRDAWRPLIDGGVLRQRLGGAQPRVVHEEPNPAHLAALVPKPPKPK